MAPHFNLASASRVKGPHYPMNLQQQYVKPIASFLISGAEVRVVFKNDPTYQGPIEELPGHIKGKEGWIKDATEDGLKVALFPVFVPTRKEHRIFCAGKGIKIGVGECYQFGRVWAAREFMSELKAADIPFTKSNFAIGKLKPEAQEATEAPEPKSATEVW